jgi:uncharacterized protein YqhQ
MAYFFSCQCKLHTGKFGVAFKGLATVKSSSVSIWKLNYSTERRSREQKIQNKSKKIFKNSVINSQKK